MPNWDSRNRSAMNSAEIAAAYLDDREDELLDAVGTAPALVGAAESVERCELLDFFDRPTGTSFARWSGPTRGASLLTAETSNTHSCSTRLCLR